ncbi:hypothetical protein C8R47DRAFT_1205906 [Mycena vitilis]|nr:hypothetical protein C8R47DRAFT_1205906 [Mycena vitilis]
MAEAPRLEVTGPDAPLSTLYPSIARIDVEAGGAQASNAHLKLSDQMTRIDHRISHFEEGLLCQDITAVKTADPCHLISRSIAEVSKFGENANVVMKALDGVKQLHPFVGVVVLAFQAAIKLELTRRDNDKRCIALKSDMMSMMEILLEHVLLYDSPLRPIKDAQKAGPDVKLFDGIRWETRLAAFSNTFAKRKAEFSLALSIHTAQGVANVQYTLTGIEDAVQTGSDSAAMLLLFRELESPTEHELRKWINDKGGATVVSSNEKLFKELQSMMKDIKDPLARKGQEEPTETTMLRVREEMEEDIDRSLARDRKQFDLKFDAVRDKLEEMKNTVRRSTDRVLAAVTSGPHDRIRDVNLSDLWREMGWRGNVKASHFVVAVQDYFLQLYSKEDQDMDDTG